MTPLELIEKRIKELSVPLKIKGKKKQKAKPGSRKKKSMAGEWKGLKVKARKGNLLSQEIKRIVIDGYNDKRVEEDKIK